MHEKIVIIDFGGQYAHLIASRIRRQSVLAEIMIPEQVTPGDLDKPEIKGIIFSGGPQSVFEEGSPTCDPGVFKLGKPILGICYGHQFLMHSLGGKVVPGKTGEFGRTEFTHDGKSPLFKDVPETSVFWMNHVDEVGELAPGFDRCGSTDECQYAAYQNNEQKIYSVQFHLEVSHSEYGNQVLSNFLDICECKRDWTIEKFYEEQEKAIKEKVGDKNVFLFVSGGVDSTVSFSLLTKILGPERVRGLFVDTGLLRQGEVEYVEENLRKIGADLTTLREADTFLGNLDGVTEPEEKRGIIGKTFLDVQQKFFAENKLDDHWLLAQGTIYPDTIESGGTKHADKIKTHHNRAPEVQKLIDEGKVIEPIAELYKDEVRALGELLGLPHELVWRHPFPGPGLGVRILGSDQEIIETIAPKGMGEVDAFTMQEKSRPFTLLPIKSVGVQGDFRTYRHPGVLKMSGDFDLTELEKHATKLINHYSEINRAVVTIDSNYSGNIKKIYMQKIGITPERVKMLQRADHIVTTILHEMDLYNDIWQFPVVLLPLSLNDAGTDSIVLRPVDSMDAMSASVGKLPYKFFQTVAKKILEDENISAVFLDVTSKPPGTIEWE